MLHQSEFHQVHFQCKGKATLQVRGPGGKHSPPESASGRDEHAPVLESAFALHHGAAASLLHQSELHGGVRCKGNLQVQVRDPGGKHSPPESASSRDEHAL